MRYSTYIYANEYPNFIDLDKKTAKFDSREFIELLNFSKNFSKKNICSPTMDTQKLYEYDRFRHDRLYATLFKQLPKYYYGSVIS